MHICGSNLYIAIKWPGLAWQKAERRKRKMVRRAAWYRPADAVGFFPPTPRGELVNNIAKVLKEEGSRIGLNLRAIETGGLSIGKQLVRPDLKAGKPCGRPGCVLDRCSGGAGGPHNVPSVVYEELASFVDWLR